MKFIPIFIILLSSLIIISYAIEEEDDDEPIDLSDLKMGTPDFEPKKFMDFFLAQKQDPEKLLKIFRTMLLKGYTHDEIIKIFKPVILSSLIDSYVPAQKEAFRVIGVLAEIKVEQIEKEVIRLLIQKFMQSKDLTILKKTLTTLVRIIVQDSKFRDLTLTFKIDSMLFKIIDFYDNDKQQNSTEIMLHVADVLKVLCIFGDKTPTEKSRTKLAMMIEYFMLENSDPEIIKSVTWAYYLLTTMSPTSNQYFLLEDIVKKHIHYLSHEDDELKYATLMVVESVVENGKSDQIQMFLKNGFLKTVPKLFENNDTKIIEKTLYILAQLLKTDRNYVNAFFEAELFANVIKNMFHKNLEIKNAASLVICFSIATSTQPQIHTLIEMGAVQGLCDVLKFMEKEDRIVYGIINGYFKMLKESEKQAKKIYDILDECDGIRILYRLKTHKNETVSDTAEEVTEIFDHVRLKEKELKMEL